MSWGFRGVATRPIGPYSLYWQCRHQGADEYRAADQSRRARTVQFRCPYGAIREFPAVLGVMGGWAAVQAAGVKLPHEIAAIYAAH
jgi:hypothetical protein